MIKGLFIGVMLGASAVACVMASTVDDMTAFENNQIAAALKQNAELRLTISTYKQMTFIQVRNALHRKGWSESSTNYAAMACSVAAFGKEF